MAKLSHAVMDHTNLQKPEWMSPTETLETIWLHILYICSLYERGTKLEPALEIVGGMLVKWTNLGLADADVKLGKESCLISS